MKIATGRSLRSWQPRSTKTINSCLRKQLTAWPRGSARWVSFSHHVHCAAGERLRIRLAAVAGWGSWKEKRLKKSCHCSEDCLIATSGIYCEIEPPVLANL